MPQLLWGGILATCSCAVCNMTITHDYGDDDPKESCMMMMMIIIIVVVLDDSDDNEMVVSLHHMQSLFPPMGFLCNNGH